MRADTTEIPRVLVLDKCSTTAHAISRVLSGTCHVAISDDSVRGLALLAGHSFDVVVSDIDLRGLADEALLACARRTSDAEVIFTLSRVPDPRRLEVMRRGAFACFDKPVDADEMALAVARAVETKRMRGEARTAREQTAAILMMLEGPRLETLVAESAKMRRAIEVARHIARSDAPALIVGEPGTGKSTIARAIHAVSARHAGPIETLCCNLLREPALETELFGYAGDNHHPDQPGLLERTHGGTIVLDAIDALPPGLQAKLDRALRERRARRAGDREERAIDVRVICSSVCDLREAVAEGRFRSDLHARLDVLPISLPPLRERPEDLPLLAALFTHRHHRSLRTPTISSGTLAVLAEHPWPGNLRALEAAVRSRASARVPWHRHEPPAPARCPEA